ncbi:MAG TPA: cytochrome c oxidase subunit II [Acidimicrobiales bacterium]|nr:cytochrome c oxidase subunit II [Acidimicrobiales bacterium]
MHVEKYERWFMYATAVVILGSVIGLIVSVAGHHAALPEPSGRVQPADIDTTAPFDQPGYRDTGEGTGELVLIGQAWQWTPQEVTVPAGTEVTIKAVSRDVIHGIRIPDTNANVMVIPGQVSEIDVNFDEPGQYSVLCHEYCGIGHHTMFMTINVE